MAHPFSSWLLPAALVLSIACPAAGGFARTAFAASTDPAATSRENGPAAAREERERVAKSIETKLIAPCCFTQPVATHYSPAADQVRAEIRRLLAGGANQQEVLDACVAKYGEQILAQPRARGIGLLAYVVPPLAFLAATVALVFTLRRWVRAGTKSAAEAGTEAFPERGDDDRYRERLHAEIEHFDR